MRRASLEKAGFFPIAPPSPAIFPRTLRGFVRLPCHRFCSSLSLLTWWASRSAVSPHLATNGRFPSRSTVTRMCLHSFGWDPSCNIAGK